MAYCLPPHTRSSTSNANCPIGLQLPLEMSRLACLTKRLALTSLCHTGEAEARRASWQARLLSALLPPTRPPLTLGLAVAACVVTATTLVLYPLKQVGPVNLMLVVYLFGVMTVSIIWGFWLAMATAAVSVLAVDYFHTSPIHEISLATPEDHTAVGAFLVVGLLTSAVANVARSRAAEADRAVEQARLLAEQRAALRRVATLVARGVSPSEIFMAVAEEIARFLKLDSAEVVRYEDDGSACIVAESGSRVWRVGDRRTLEGDNVAAMVLRTGRPARMDTYEDAQGL